MDDAQSVQSGGRFGRNKKTTTARQQQPRDNISTKWVNSAGEAIERMCDENGIKGLDQFMQDVRMRENQGLWAPVLFDFKHIPVDRESAKKGNFLFKKLSFGRRKGRPGFLGDWDELAERPGA